MKRALARILAATTALSDLFPGIFPKPGKSGA